MATKRKKLIRFSVAPGAVLVVDLHENPALVQWVDAAYASGDNVLLVRRPK